MKFCYKDTLPDAIYNSLVINGPMSAASLAARLNKDYRGTLNACKIAAFCRTLKGEGRIGYEPDSSNSYGGRYFVVREGE